jgi:hypothetical protein
MRTKFTILGVLATFLGCASVAAAGEPVVFFGSDTFETTIVPNGACPGNTLSTEDRATGQASLLGRYTFTAGECVNLGTLEVSLGFFTLTAADGSTITGNYSGTVQLTDGNSFLYAVSGFITDGTGRFEKTTGTVAMLGGATLTSSTTATGFDKILAGDLYLAK